MTEIIIIVILILLNGIFAMSEIAVISARKSSLSTDIKKGSRRARYALKLANEPDRFLSTVQIGITLIGILTGIYSGAQLSDDFAVLLIEAGVAPVIADEIAQITIVVIVTYLTLILGELVPKRIGMAASEKAAKLIARPMYYLSIIASPFVKLLAASTSGMFNLLGLKDAETKVTEEEIKSIVQEGKEDGEVQEVEQDIVERVFQLGDMKVSSLMTYRSDLVTIDINMDKQQVKDVLREKIYQVYPLIDKNLDNVKGVIRIKDLILELDNPDFNIADICRQATVFHENMSVYKALEKMRDNSTGSALVFDEFGSCQGLITLKDIMEGLVGKFEDINTEPDIIERADGNSWLVDGQCSIYDFLSYFEADDLNEEYSFNTVGGLILKQLGDIPQSGDVVVWNYFRLEVVDMDGARIDKILVTKIEKTAEQ